MEIQFYQTMRGDYPVLEFIESTPEQHQKKIRRHIKWFKELPLQESLQGKDAKRITGNKYKGLYELIIDRGNICYRIFFIIIKNTCWLIHAFRKKSNKTPTRELAKANNIKKTLEHKYQ